MPTNSVKRTMAYVSNGGAAFAHGSPRVEGDLVGIASKQETIHLMDGLSTDIQAGEDYVLRVRGVVEVPLAGGAAPGQTVYALPPASVTLDNTAVTVYTVLVTDATDGTFAITVGDQTTDPEIAYDADAATVLAALEALSNLEVGDVHVAATVGGFEVTLEDESLILTADDTNLIGGGTEEVTVTDAAVPGVLFGQIVSVDADRATMRVDLDRK